MVEFPSNIKLPKIDQFISFYAVQGSGSGQFLARRAIEFVLEGVKGILLLKISARLQLQTYYPSFSKTNEPSRYTSKLTPVKIFRHCCWHMAFLSSPNFVFAGSDKLRSNFSTRKKRRRRTTTVGPTTATSQFVKRTDSSRVLENQLHGKQ